MKRNHVLWIVLMAALFITACQNRGEEPASGADSSISGSVQTAETAAGTTVTADQETLPKPDYTPVIAKGYQFMKQLGICKPGNPVVYLTDSQGTSGITNEYAKARLTDSFYQDKMLVIRVILEDTSISVIPADEVELLLEKERENQEKQDRNEAVVWDNSYFCIDMEEKIYGRSRFMESLNRDNLITSGHMVDARLYPPGITEHGYGFHSRSSRVSYEEYEGGWRSITTAELQLSGVPFTEEELVSTFKLELDGFEEPLSFRFQAAKEVASLEEIPSWTTANEVSFLALGERNNQDLTVFLYPVKEDYMISPVTAKVTYRTAGSEEEKTCLLQSDMGGQNRADLFAGLYPSGVRRFTCHLPDGEEIRDVKLVLNQLTLNTEERSGIYPIPIPDKEVNLDLDVEFRDGTLHLTKAERMTEKINVGLDEDGNEILKPGIYLSAQAEAKTEGMQMGLVFGYDANYLDEKGEVDMYRMGTVFPDVTDQPWHECEVKGYRIPYDPEAEEIDLLFWNPTYLLGEEVVLPVEFDGLIPLNDTANNPKTA